MYFLERISMWIFGNLGLVLFLAIIFFILRGFYRSMLTLRASSCNTIWLEGTIINSETLFESIKTKISSKNLDDVSFSFTHIPDSFGSPNTHRYLKVRYKSFCAYISAFPFGENGIISYWVIPPMNPWQTLFNLLPVYGKVIFNILRTPSLYMADINSVSHTMVRDEIQAAINEQLTETPKIRETKQEFKSYIEALTAKRK